MRMGGRASPFGVDADRAGALVRRLIDSGADWRGFHIFAGSQALDAQAIIETQAATLALAARLADEAGAPPPPMTDIITTSPEVVQCSDSVDRKSTRLNSSH